MLFSVIVPVYNVQSYLEQCLNSLVQQTCKDTEIIVVDDGSTDSSGAICDEFATNYNFVKVIHQENQGLASARNTGMAQAQGEWLCFVDADDWVDDNMLELLQMHILATDADLYRFGYKTVDDSGLCKHDYEEARTPTLFSLPDEKTRFRYYFSDFAKTVRVWADAYRRSLIEEHDLHFVDERRIYAEDMLFNFQYMLYAKTMLYLPDSPYYYRLREGSLTDLTDFQTRLLRVETLSEMAYQTVMSEDLPLFQQYFYYLYFRFLNRFIMRDAKDLDDYQIRRVLNKLSRRAFYRTNIQLIREHDEALRSYTPGRIWYAKSFGSTAHMVRQKLARGICAPLKHIPLAWRLWFRYQSARYKKARTLEAQPVYYRAPGCYKVAYLPNAKVACSSISVSMLKQDGIADDYSIFEIRRKYKTKRPFSESDWFTFSFVRNPFERLVSCYESKFHTDRVKNRRALERRYFEFDRYMHGYMQKDRGFAHFVKQISRIPWRLDNTHFCVQYHRLVGEDGKPLVTFIGRMENLEEDYEPIRQKYGFSPLKTYNKSDHGDWRDYYTTKLVNKVYQKYKLDVEYFGYEQEYKDLLAYCAKKEHRL